MRKVTILILLVSFSLLLMSCGMLNYKSEGTGVNMHVKTNMANYNAVPDSIWELAPRNRVNIGTLDNGEYSLYKYMYDANSAVLRVENHTSKSPYPKFFVKGNGFLEFKLEYINRIRFLGVDSYEKYLNINTYKKTLVSFVDKWETPELVKALYDAVIKRDNKAAQYPEFENQPKLGFLEWGCSVIEHLQLLTDLAKINDNYFLIVQYGYDDQPRDLIQIDSQVANYLLNTAEESVLPG